MQCVRQILLNPLKIDLGFLADNSPVMFLRVGPLLHDGTEDVGNSSAMTSNAAFSSLLFKWTEGALAPFPQHGLGPEAKL